MVPASVMARTMRPGGRRRRCGGGRGSRPRRGRRRGPPARTCGRGRGRPTRRARSCPPRAGPHQGDDRRLAAGRRLVSTSRARGAACARPAPRRCGPSPRRDRCGRRRARPGRWPGRGRPSERTPHGHLEHGVEPGADPPVLGGLGRGALEASELALDRLGDRRSGSSRSASLARYSSTRSSSSAPSPSSLRMAASCWRSRNSRWVFSMPFGDLGADAVRHLALGQGLLDPGGDPLEAVVHVDGLEQLDLALDGQVRPPPGRVGQGAGGLDVAEHGAHAPSAQPLEQHAGRGPVLAGQLLVRSLGSGSSTSSAWTHRASPVPTTPDPTRARRSARMTRAGVPLGSCPWSSTRADRRRPGRSARRPGARAGCWP